MVVSQLQDHQKKIKTTSEILTQKNMDKHAVRNQAKDTKNPAILPNE
jgi:hypothetical protein